MNFENINCCPDVDIIQTEYGFCCSWCGILLKTFYWNDYFLNKSKPKYNKLKYLNKKINKYLSKIKYNNLDCPQRKIIFYFMKYDEIIKWKYPDLIYSMNYNYILFQIFKKLNLDNSIIEITNNPTILERYENIWDDIKDLI